MKDEYICYRTACRYHSGRVDGNVPSCNYFFITGETKTSRGEADITRKCGLYKPGTAPRPRPQPIALPNSPVRKKRAAERKEAEPRRLCGGRRYNWGQFEALWKEGKTDNAIAKEVGCHRDTVTAWRRRAGLPPNVFRYVIDTEKLKKYWAEGLNDPQIAERLGASRQAVQKARIALGLPTHSPRMSHGKVKK